MLVVAGAGTGKTTVLAHRIAHLIQSEAAKPDEILAVTYTRNSAAELINRVAAILYPESPTFSVSRDRSAESRPQAAGQRIAGAYLPFLLLPAAAPGRA